MTLRIATLVSLMLFTVGGMAVAQPIHGHPQKAGYASPAEWPTISDQAHWSINGDLAHLHVDLTCPIYAEVPEGAVVTCPFSVTLHHFPGHVMFDSVYWAGLFGYARTTHWDATGSDVRPQMIGDPQGDRVWTGTVSLEQRTGITGWWEFEFSITGELDNGDHVGMRNTVAMWLVSSGTGRGKDAPHVEARATFQDVSNPERVWGDTVTGYNSLLPLAPISVPWPVITYSYQYGPSDQIVSGTFERRIDLDLHHGIPGTTVFGPVANPTALVIPFEPAVMGNGVHKVAGMWNAPIQEQAAASLAVFSMTVDPNAPPIVPDLGFTPPPPPPPPAPLPTWETVTPLIQRFGTENRYRLCLGTSCVEFVFK